MPVLPTHDALMSVFDNHWSDALWTKIEAERDATGFNLNESIWNIANNAQEKAYTIIRDAEQKGITFDKVKKELATLLTEKGKSNMGYNVKRLWVNQLKTDRIIAQKSVWEDMGYVQNVILSRSDHAMPCEICDEEVGEGAGAERVVPLDYGNWPPFHPWCECDARPEKPSAKAIAAFLKGETGSPEVQAVVQAPEPSQMTYEDFVASLNAGAEPAATIPGEPFEFFGADENMENAKAAIYDNGEGKYYIIKDDGLYVKNPDTTEPLFDTAEQAWKEYYNQSVQGEPTTLLSTEDYRIETAKSANQRAFENNAIDVSGQFTGAGMTPWSDNAKGRFLGLMSGRLGGMSDKMQMPTLQTTFQSAGAIAFYDNNDNSIDLNILENWTPEHAAEVITHEYGHAIMHSMEEGERGLSGATDTERTNISGALTNALDAIQRWTMETPEGEANPDLSRETLESLYDSISNMNAPNPPVQNTGPIMDAISDMAAGKMYIGASHEHYYLTDPQRELMIEGSVYSMSTQEAFNELWSGYLQLQETEGAKDVEVEIENYLPGVLDAIRNWIKVIAGGF